MGFLSIVKSPTGTLETVPISTEAPLPTEAEKAKAYLEEKRRIREEEIPTRIITAEQLGKIAEPEHKCPHCEITSKTAQGLSSHLRNSHKDLIVADGV